MKDLSEAKKKHKILLLDFASEKNRGDAAMQVSIVKLVKKYFPESQLFLSTVFGANQFPASISQLDHTLPDGQITVCGGLLSTYETLEKSRSHGKSFRKLKQIFAGFKGALLLGLLFLRIPPHIFSWMLSAESRRSLQIFAENDLVIWNGRNFRSHSKFKEPYDLFILFFNPLVCMLLRKKMACVGASVWELHNPFARWMSRIVFSSCAYISAREIFSFRYLNTLFAGRDKKPDIVQLPDLSLYILGQLNSGNQRRYDEVSNDFKIGLTIVGAREVGSEELQVAYVEKMQSLTNHIAKKMDAHLVVLPQVTYTPEENSSFVNRIIEQLPNTKHLVVSGENKVEELVERYRDLDFLIATRMHSAIFALTTGTPVLAIAYDYGAKWNILCDMGLPAEAIVNMNELPYVNLVERFEEVWSRRAKLLKTVSERLTNDLYPNVEKHIALAQLQQRESL